MSETLLQVRCPNCQEATVVAEGGGTDFDCHRCGGAITLKVDATINAVPEWTEELLANIEDGTATAALPTHRVGHFLLLEQLGAGAFGEVWKAKDEQLDRLVAIKMPHAVQMNPEQAEAFMREARAAAQLSHPNIVSVHEVGNDDGRVYLVSDFVEGVTLDDWIAGDETPSQQDAVEMTIKLALALHHAHEAGVVHRDLKPSNVMIDTAADPHVMDFGLAKRDAGEVTSTIAGSVMGTPAYMSPEQAGGDGYKATRATDVYSLGVMLFEMLTGERPFRGNTRMLLHQVLIEEPPSPRSLDGSISRDLETICLKCMEKSPDRRYETAQELAIDLQCVLDGEPIFARPVSAVERLWRWGRRKPLVAGLSAAVLLSLTVGAIVSTSFAIESRKQADYAVAVALKERAAHTLAEEKTAEAEANRLQAEANRQQAEELAEIAQRQLQLAELGTFNVQLSRAREELSRAPRVALSLLRDTERCPLNMRDFAWFQLYGKANAAVKKATAAPEHVELFNHAGRIRGIAFSENRLISGGFGPQDGLRVWSPEGGTRNQSPVNIANLTGFAVSPSGELIATAEQDGRIRVWSAATREPIDEWMSQQRELDRIVFAPRGNLLATVGQESVKVWDCDAGKLVREIPTESATSAVAFTRNAWQVITVGEQNTIEIHRVFDESHRNLSLNTLYWGRFQVDLSDVLDEPLQSITLKGHTATINDFAVSPDGETLASVDSAGVVRLWNLKTHKERARLNRRNSSLLAVCFSPDGKTLAAAGFDHSITLWDAVTGQVRNTLKGHSSAVCALAFSEDSRTLASGGTDGSVLMWPTGTGREIATLHGHVDQVQAVDVSFWGNWIASAGADMMILIRDRESGVTVHRLEGHTDQIWDVAFAPNGETLASTSADRSIRIWNVSTGEQLKRIDCPLDQAFSIAYSPDGSRLASAGGAEDCNVTLWDLKTGEAVKVLRGHTRLIFGVAFSPDGQYLASAGGDGTAKIWDAEDGSLLHTLEGHESYLTAVAFSPNGKQLATAGNDKVAKVWETKTGKLQQTLAGHTKFLTSISFVGRKHIATGADDGTLRVWSTVTGDEKYQIKSGSGVTSLAVSTIGELVSGHLDHSMRIWSVR